MRFVLVFCFFFTFSHCLTNESLLDSNLFRSLFIQRCRNAEYVSELLDYVRDRFLVHQCFFDAIERGNDKLLEQLMPLVDPRIRNRGLIRAIRNDRIVAIEALVERDGADLTAFDDDIINFSKESTIEKLINLGTNPLSLIPLRDSRNSATNQIVLSYIIKHRDQTLFLEECRTGQTARVAQIFGSISDNRFLLNQGLVYAVKGNHSELVKFLLGKGADPSFRLNLPFRVAIERGLPSMIDILFDKVPNPWIGNPFSHIFPDSRPMPVFSILVTKLGRLFSDSLQLKLSFDYVNDLSVELSDDVLWEVLFRYTTAPHDSLLRILTFKRTMDLEPSQIRNRLLKIVLDSLKNQEKDILAIQGLVHAGVVKNNVSIYLNFIMESDDAWHRLLLERLLFQRAREHMKAILDSGNPQVIDKIYQADLESIQGIQMLDKSIQSAACKGNSAFVAALLDKGVSSVRPLICAARNNHYDTVKLILEHPSTSFGLILNQDSFLFSHFLRGVSRKMAQFIRQLTIKPQSADTVLELWERSWSAA